MTTPSLRIAHLSDLHFRAALPGTSPLPLRRSREFLVKEVLAQVVEKGADLIAITGDLLDVPSFLLDGGLPRGFSMPEGEGVWREAAEKDYRFLRETLEATGVPWLVVPGNHDSRKEFQKIFGDQPVDWHLKGVRLVLFFDEEQENHQPRRLYPERNRFDSVLHDADSTPQIHFQHYLLFPFPGKKYPFHYLEHDYLTHEIAKSGRVIASMSGHAHRGMEPEWVEGTVFSVAPALCEAPFRWRMFEISGKEVRWEDHRLPEREESLAIFLDRDGVISDLGCYFYGPEEMRLVPGAGKAIARLNAAGAKVVVVTSQSAIGMGYVTRAVVEMVLERMNQLLAGEGAFVDAIYFTEGAGDETVVPSLKDAPTAKSGLILQALKELPLKPGWIVGDRLSDMEAGREAGLPGLVLVRSGLGREQEAAGGLGEGVSVVDDLAAAVELILSSEER